jgi:hypothetical protein
MQVEIKKGVRNAAHVSIFFKKIRVGSGNLKNATANILKLH